MKNYLIVSGDRLTKFPVVAFIDDGEKITVYSANEQSRRMWQSYVDRQEGPTVEKLASRFTYVNTDFGPVTSGKKLELEKMIKALSVSAKPITAAFPGDDAWRSAKAKLQRRDRHGRFAEMGGGFSFALRKRDGSMSRVTGKIVGQSGEENVDIDVKDNDSLPDGVYSVPASKGEAVKAVISLKGLDDAKVDKDKSSTVFPANTPFVTEDEIGKAPELPETSEQILPESSEERKKYVSDFLSKFSPKTVESSPKEHATFGEIALQTKSYEIDGEKVLFAAPGEFEENSTDVRPVPVNPYAISGLSKDSSEGQNIAEKWYYARIAMEQEKGSTDVEALL